VIGGNGDSIFKRLMEAIDREDIGLNPKYSTNEKRSQHASFLDSVIEEWTKEKRINEVLQILTKFNIPAGKIYSIEDIVNDEHYNSRNMILNIDTEIGEMKMPGIVPKLSKTPGKVKWAGPKLGEHNSEILEEN